MSFPIDIIIRTMVDKDYCIFRNGSVNLVGIRNPNRTSNYFDDILYCFRFVNNECLINEYAITTDPGAYWLENPMRVEGTAILKEGQYLGLWYLSTYGRGYPHLKQKGICTVYRDNNRDKIINLNADNLHTGNFGIELHRSGKGQTEAIDRWSAGCQVFQDNSQYDDFILGIIKDADKYGNSFTYTLINTEELVLI